MTSDIAVFLLGCKIDSPPPPVLHHTIRGVCVCVCVFFLFFFVVVVVVFLCVCVWWGDGSIGCSSSHVLLTSTQIEFYYPDYFNFLILSSGRM